MKIFRFLLHFLLMVQLSACGGAGGGGDVGPSAGSGDPITSGIGQIIADTENGVDENSFTSRTVFKTITSAINASKDKEVFPAVITIMVKPGIYSDTKGEVFPLELNNGIKLQAELGVTLENSGLSSRNVSGINKPVTVVLNDSSSISNFVIKSQLDGIGILVETGSPKLSKNEITDNGTGIVVLGNSTPDIQSNVIHKNGIGVETFSTSQAIISSNVIIDNVAGINVLDSSIPELGTLENPGLNTIKMNSNYDLCNITTNTLMAIGNQWDEITALVKDEKRCINGADVGNINGGVVIFSDLPKDGNAMFSDSSKISLTSPPIGAVISNDKPSFSWLMGNTSNLVALGVFSKRIIVKGGEITNTIDLVYFWNSGVGKGRVGSIEFNDGQRYVDGELVQNEVPTSLERGKTYYWTVWSWDSDGLNITQSAQEGYFTLRN